MKAFPFPTRWSLGPAHFIFALVLLLRLLGLARLTESSFLLPSRGDMYFYNDWAQRILQGQLTDHLAFYGLPLYAYLLAFLYKVFGYSPFVPGFIQSCLEAGTAVLIYKIALLLFTEPKREEQLTEKISKRRLFYQIRGHIIGGVAAVAWGFFVPAQAYSVILMPTAWLVFVFWFIVWRAARRREAPTLIGALGYGLLVGVTAMGIATILFLLPLIAAAILIYPTASKRSSALRRKIAALALLFIGVALGTSPCWIHNYFVAKDRVFLSAHSGINIWIGNNPISNGYPRFPPGLRPGQAAMLQDSINVAESASGRPLKRSEVSAYWSEKARSHIKNNFGEWLKLVALKGRNFWNAFQYDDLSIITILREQGVILPGPGFGLVAALAIPGMILGLRNSRRTVWIVAAIFLHMTSLLMVFVTERYRLAVVPGLLLFAGFGVWKLWEYLLTTRWDRSAAYLSMLAAATIFVSLPQRSPALWALDAYNSGWQALESKDLPLAQKKLEAAHAYVPDNAEINLALGNLWLEKKDPDKAKAFYQTALAIDPRHKSALSNLGVIALDEGQWDLALRLFRAAVEVAPVDAKTRYLLARAALENGDTAAALEEIEIALRLKPDQPEFTRFLEELRQRQ